jgi:hypothetical protein
MVPGAGLAPRPISPAICELTLADYTGSSPLAQLRCTVGWTRCNAPWQPGYPWWWCRGVETSPRLPGVWRYAAPAPSWARAN